MSTTPTDLLYTKNHEWVRGGEQIVTLGITEFAVDQLGAIGFIELPYAGEMFKGGDLVGRMSSDTGAATVRMPFTGKIMEINQALGESPGIINGDPYGEGWIARIEPGDPADVDGLMAAADYEAFLSAKDG